MIGGPAIGNDDLFGRSVTSLGDLDGDGVTDLAVGAIRADTGQIGRGALHLLMLQPDGNVKNASTIGNDTNGGPTLDNQTFFGGSVALMGDIDGDGVSDLAVGAPYDDTGGTHRGAVYVLFLKTLEATPSVTLPDGGGDYLIFAS